MLTNCLTSKSFSLIIMQMPGLAVSGGEICDQLEPFCPQDTGSFTRVSKRT
jgi:hypothetical protein